jgi:hypothetical protein
MLFGYPIEPDFDLAKEQRRDRVGWVLMAGVVFFGVYLFSGLPYPNEVFQAWFATVLFYGASFYVKRRNELGKPWLSKLIMASVPMHVAYLAALFWSDHTFPNVMTKAMVFMPVIAFAFAIESIVIDRMADWFKPSKAEQIRSASRT